MDFIIKVLWLLEMLGLAAVFGGFFHQINEKARNITNGMFIGGLVQFGALVLIYIKYLTDGWSLDANAIVALVVSLAIAVIGFLYRNKREDNMPIWAAAGLLAAVAFALPIFW